MPRLREATLEAGDAATSTATAREEADAVKKETGEIQSRLDSASTQLSAIEARVRIQGPRWLILVDNKNKFIRDLKPFNGTKVTVLICGGPVYTNRAIDDGAKTARTAWQIRSQLGNRIPIMEVMCWYKFKWSRDDG